MPSISTSKLAHYAAVNELLARGDFSGAISALGSDWRGPGVIPERNEHDTHSYAAILMFCGVLTAEFGLMGSRLQEKSKDMLSKSIRLFGDDVEGAQVARAWLGTAYDRCGDFNEALALADSLIQSKDTSLNIMVCATKTKAIALDGLGRPQEALDALTDISALMNAVVPIIRGKCYLQRGKVLRQLGRLDEALEDYDLAVECFYEAKSSRYEAVASNNIAGVYIDQNDFARAHVLTEKAVRLFKEIGDQNHEGMAWDQIAQIYRKEEKFYEAIRAARTAVDLLQQGDHLDFLAEAYTTLGTALIERGMTALEPLEKAAVIYEQQGNLMRGEEVNALMWSAVVKIKKLAKDTSAAMHKSVRPFERRVIEQTLEKHGGHISPAAKELGMNHRSLRDKIAQRFPDLLDKCQPVTPRKKSIIRK